MKGVDVVIPRRKPGRKAGVPATKSGLRQAARRLTQDVSACQTCGATAALQRHHPDYSHPEIVEVLCRPCHIKADQRDGTRHKKHPKRCAHCGQQFMPRHSTNKLCGLQCRLAVASASSLKRWRGAHAA